MVLSCCDLLVVLTRHPLTTFCAMLWFSETLNGYPRWLYTSLRSSVVFVALSLNALVIMSFERYLGTSYSIFHRTSVTKAKLSTLFAIYTKYHDSPSLRFFIIFQRLCYFLRSFYSSRFHHSLSCHVVFQLQVVHGRQEKS